METIGGGIILDDQPKRHRRNRSEVLEALRIKESGSGSDQLLQIVTEFGMQLPTAAQIHAKLGGEEAEVKQQLQELCERGRAVEPLAGRYAAASVIDKLWSECSALLTAYHKQNPLHAGIRAAELRQKLCKGMEQSCADAFLGALRQEGKIRRVAERYALADFTVVFSKRQRAIRDRMLQIFSAAGVESPSIDDMYSEFSRNEKAEAVQVLESLVSAGELVMLTPQICWHRTVYDKACETAKEHFKSNEALTLAEFRDLMGTSRKYSQAALEYFDKLRITRKDGDVHRLAQGFED